MTYDTDTHIVVTAEQLEPYLPSDIRETLPNIDDYKKPITIASSGRVLEPPYRHRFRFEQPIVGWRSDKRVLGEAEPRTEPRPYQSFRGGQHPTTGCEEYADIRIADMDAEGTDVHMMVPLGANGHENPYVEMEFIRAQHRWLNDFCSPYPRRLKSLLVVTARSIKESLEEIHTWGSAPWAVGIQPYLPLDFPLDHPDMNPIWEAAEQEGLCVVHHSFEFGYPGYRDLWGNSFIGRTASHPWAAMRFVASTVGSGMYDRFPGLRFGVLESGFGWIPWWSKRMDEQMAYVGYVADGLKLKPSEYLKSGRFFCSLEMHEGLEIVQSFIDLMGENVLMMGSDYPHPESHFPESINEVLAWKSSGISDSAMKALMWDNPVRLYGEP